MIIWLASYPKSGNTMLRSLLSAYFFSDDGKYNFELIKNIKQFPTIELFEELGVNISSDDEVIKSYIKVQEKFCKENSVQFLKTHSYLFNFYNKYPFTDLKKSLGVIYIVRDPRNVVTSFSKFSNYPLEKTCEFMINNMSFGGNIEYAKTGVRLGVNTAAERTKVWIGNWAQNYQSWKSFKYQERYLLVKYEDLVKNTEKVFFDILKFIHKINNSKFILNKKKFMNVLESTSFKNMQKLEKKKSFQESKFDKKTGKKIPFFNYGPKNNWKDLLSIENKEKIEKAFFNEMNELGYL